MKWYVGIGVDPERLRFHEHGPDELAHYARAAFDIEYKFGFGQDPWHELEGIHNRGDFDLSRHQEFAGKKLEYFEEATRERFIPYIIETSAGCDRTLLMLLVNGYREEEIKGEKRVFLGFHPRVAPIKAAVFPLVKKDGMPETAEKLFEELRPHFDILYDAGGSIGRRYARQDETGTPFCITIDGQTGEDQTVTVRHRDTLEQERVSLDQVRGHLTKLIEKS